MEHDQSAHHWEQTAKTAELRVQQLELALEHAKIHEETSRDLGTGLETGEKAALLSNQVSGRRVDWDIATHDAVACL
jgi:hypothetical protein